MSKTPWGGESWVFTLNNYDSLEHDHLMSVVEKYDECKYIIFGREKKRTPHLQGFVAFGGSMLLQEVRAIISKRAHFEVARMVAIEYDGDVFEAGVKPNGVKHYTLPPLDVYWCNDQSASYVRGSTPPSGCAVHGLKGCPLREFGAMVTETELVYTVTEQVAERDPMVTAKKNPTTTTTTTTTTRNGNVTTITIVTLTEEDEDIASLP
jgi:Putative viral replication protein